MTIAAKFGLFASTNLRRVRREEAIKHSFVKPDGLETCLACWKDWMTGDQEKDLSIKGASIYKDGAAELDNDGKPIARASLDIHEAQQEVDNRVAMATDAMINSLERRHVWALYRACGISTVWRYPNSDILTVAAEAKSELTKKLKNNVCTSRLF